MIRPATHKDRLAVIGLLRDSRLGAGFDSAEGPTGFTFPFVAAYAERLFLLHLAEPLGFCVVFEVGGTPRGVLMAQAFEHPFGPVMIARETVWWIDPGHRGRAAIEMLNAYEGWARNKGCTFVGMAGMGADPDVAALYHRRGYRTAETHFLKAV